MNFVQIYIVTLTMAVLHVNHRNLVSADVVKSINTSNNENLSRNRRYWRLVNDLALDFPLRKPSITVTYQTEFNLKIISRDPCLLIKVASYFDSSNIQIIVSRRLIDFQYSLDSCKGVFGEKMRNSIIYIEGNENSSSDLKLSLTQFLDRDTRCFFVLCSKICTRMILQVVDSIGFGIVPWLIGTIELRL